MDFAAELWEHHGEGAWVFLTVPEDVSEEIRLQAGEPRGFGSVRVEVATGATTWRTSVFPDSARGCYVLPVKKAVRRAEGVEVGDRVTVRLRVLDLG
jgi:hypothetical protein